MSRERRRTSNTASAPKLLHSSQFAGDATVTTLYPARCASCVAYIPTEAVVVFDAFFIDMRPHACVIVRKVIPTLGSAFNLLHVASRALTLQAPCQRV